MKTAKLITACILISGMLPFTDLYAKDDRKVGENGVLVAKYLEPGVRESFRPSERCLPFPEYSDRAAWKNMAGPEYARTVISAAEKFIGYKWRQVPATAFMAVKESGSHDSKRFETSNREALVKLAAAEALEGKGRFMKDLADGFWFYSSCHHWTLVTNGGSSVIPVSGFEKVDLGSGRTAQSLAIIWYIFGAEFDKMDPMIGETFRASVKRIILDPFLNPAKDKSHWWLGIPRTRRLNNHTPWNIGSALTCFFVAEPSQERLDSAILKGLTSLDFYLSDFPADGLCDEGPTYWFNSVGRFCALLKMLREASGGKYDVMPNPFISSLGSYISRCCAGQTSKGGEIVANYGDAEPFTNFDPFVLWEAGEFLGSKELKNLAIYSMSSGKDFRMPKVEKSEAFKAFTNLKASRTLEAEIKKYNMNIKDGDRISNILQDLRSGIPASTYYPDGGQLFIRTGDGWFFSGKAAWNGESHNHNDAGSFMLYSSGVPVMVDPGVGAYTVKTFGPHRYELWTMVSPWHNIPVINGALQHHGGSYKTENPEFRHNRNVYEFSMDIQKAYVAEAACNKWHRTYRITDKRGGSTLEIEDSFSLSERKAPDVEHFIVQGEVSLSSKGKIIIRNRDRSFVLTYPADILTFSTDEQTDLDRTLRKVWGKKLIRINLTSAQDAPLEGTYKLTLKEMK